MTAVTVADVPAVSPTPAGAPAAPAAHDLSWLGDPFAPDNPAGFAQAVGRARRGERPTALLERARAEGLHLLYTPRAWGGALDDPVRAGRTARTLVARDGDVMTNLLMSLTPVLVTGLLGSGAQRASAVDAVTRGADVGYALSEREHGSDLLRMDTTARTDGSRVVLDGRKWWVGRAPTAERFVVVARSGGRGPTAFSAYDVPADAPGLSVDAPHGTAGFPGTAFADVGLSGVTIPSTALLGAEGSAMEAILRSQSVVRVLSLPASLAGMDADLMLLGRIAEERRGVARSGTTTSSWPTRAASPPGRSPRRPSPRAPCARLLTDPASAVLRSACAKHVVSRCVQQVHDLVGDALSTRGSTATGRGACTSRSPGTRG
ncbi:acyl-CoA dehydrogenase family protein [Clavibacter tessellarius]|uniref:acyl-CoA dehydrogenase family protein n=1 Tax=Clavibacter tessellarius TaxID=31965 RepID=UPI00324CBF6B